MKTLKDLEPVKHKIPEYIKEGLKGVFDGGRYNNFNWQNAFSAVKLQYEKSGFKAPVMVVAENPYEAQIMFNYIRSNGPLQVLLGLLWAHKPESEQLDSQLDSQLYSQLDSQLYSQLDSQLDSQLYSQLRLQLDSQLDSQLRSQLYSQLGSQLRSQLYSQLYSQLGSQLYSQLDSQLYSQLDSQLRSQLGSQLYSQLDSQLYSQLDSQLDEYHNSYLFTLNIWSSGYFQYYKFIAKELGIVAGINEGLEIFSSAYESSNIYNAIFSEALCVVSKFPKKVYRNVNNDLHNTKGVAVEWGHSIDGTKFQCYYINGRNISKDIAELALNNEVTKEVFVKEQNDESRSAWYAYLGEEKMLEILEASQVDVFHATHNNGESETITLFQTKEALNTVKNKPYAWLKRVCPSTGTTYLTPTNPDFKSAEESAKFHRPDFVPSSVKYKWHSRS